MRFSLRRFYLYSVIISLGTLVALTVGVAIYTESQRNMAAKRMADMVRNELLMGDYRGTMVRMNLMINKEFEYITFHDGWKQQVFAIGESSSWLRAIAVPVRLTASSDNPAEVAFYYNPWRRVGLVAGLWLFLVLVNIPLMTAVARRLRRFYETRERSQTLATIGEMSRQVAHDLRSPISVIKVLGPRISFHSPQEQALFNEAVVRLETTASDVLVKAKRSMENGPAASEAALASPTRPISEQQLQQLIESTLELKKAEHLSAASLSFYPDSFSAVEIDPDQFGRMLSNLINNAVEAAASKVIISARAEQKSFYLEIRDNGRGMPPEVLKMAGTEGFSSGKSRGNGLGLFAAKRLVESWGGSLKIHSQVGSGSSILISLAAMG